MRKSYLAPPLLFFVVVVGGYYAVSALIAGRAVFIPLVFAAFFALLVRPLAAFLEKKGVPPLLAALAGILAGLSVFGLVAATFILQLNSFVADLPFLYDQLSGRITAFQQYISLAFGVEPAAQVGWLADRILFFFPLNGAVFETLKATTNIVLLVALIPVFAFFILLYRRQLYDALIGFFSRRGAKEVNDAFFAVQAVVQRYFLGLAAVVYIVGVLNTLGLFFLGLEHALFFGTLAALLSVIPYVGTTIGAVLPAIFALLTRDALWYPLAVIAVFVAVQWIEDNIVTPNIVGHQVLLNPLFAVLAVFIGGQMWGILGMMVFLPLFAVIKIFCDHVESLKPIGAAMGLRSREP
ncbi:MAG: AI-2E family transporter [Patescibacteria group bacterium]